MADDWSSFQSYDDDEDLLLYDKVVDRQEYAVEDDSQDTKETVGMARKAPTIERDAEPIQVISGTYESIASTVSNYWVAFTNHDALAYEKCQARNWI